MPKMLHQQFNTGLGVFLQFWSIFTGIALASAVGFIELCNLEGN